jgi:hypothetical protein
MRFNLKRTNPRYETIPTTQPNLCRHKEMLVPVWRPVRESNPCRRREREGTYCISKELSGMDSTLPHLKDSPERLLDL